jgi:uncharacterized delta-60 repeat protein
MGRILLGGGVEKPNSTLVDSFVVRLTPNGQPDMTFGVGGVAQFATQAVQGLFVDSTGIWVSGGYYVQGGVADLRRLHDDGSLDSTVFHTDAAVATYWDVKGVSDGVLVGSQNAVLKFALDGSVMTSYGTGGAAKLQGGDMYAQAKHLFVQPDGKVVVVGLFQLLAAVWRLLPDGSPETSFGTQIVVDLALENNLATNLLCDGRIVVADEYSLTQSAPGGFFAAYLRPDGTSEPGVGDDGGIFSWPVPAPDSGAGLTEAAAVDARTGKVAFVRDDHGPHIRADRFDPP